MVVIKRGKEPDSLLEFRLQNSDADYEDMPSEVRDDVREQMAEFIPTTRKSIGT